MQLAIYNTLLAFKHLLSESAGNRKSNSTETYVEPTCLKQCIPVFRT